MEILYVMKIANWNHYYNFHRNIFVIWKRTVHTEHLNFDKTVTEIRILIIATALTLTVFIKGNRKFKFKLASIFMIRGHGNYESQNDNGNWKFQSSLKFLKKYFCYSKDSTTHWVFKFSQNDDGNSEFE